LRVMHPFMPFVTEEIWQNLPRDTDSIMVSSWPHIQKQMISLDAEKEMKFLIGVVTSIRNIRAAWHIQPNAEVDISVKTDDDKNARIIRENLQMVQRLAGIKNVEFKEASYMPKGVATCVVLDAQVYVHLEGIIDIQKESQRMKENLDKVERDLAATTAKLGNKEFTGKAPKDIVEGAKRRKQELEDTLKKLKENLRNL